MYPGVIWITADIFFFSTKLYWMF